jgi:ribose transport system permease protein
METTNKAKRFFKSKTFTLILLTIFVIALFSMLSKGSFFSLSNLKNVLNAMVLYMLLAIGEGILIIFGEIDLSIGYIGTMCGVIIAILMTSLGLPWYVAIVGALALGAAYGLFNAFLINELGFQAFIATMATGQFISKGLTLVISGGKVIPIKDPIFTYIGNGKIFEIFPASITISLALIIVYGIILAKTKFGRSVYLCGGNRNAARLAGLNPRRISYILFANSGFLGAIAGIVFAARMKGGNLTGTSAYAFTAITAAILGGISFGGGAGGMLGCFFGLLIMNTFSNGLTVLQVNPYWQSVANGVLLLVALSFDYFNARSAMKVRAPKAVKSAT